MRVKVFSQGEGAVNTVGGLRPNTVTPNITGDIKSFWRYEYIYIYIYLTCTIQSALLFLRHLAINRLLDDSRHVLNWNGDVSPVVHQVQDIQQTQAILI